MQALHVNPAVPTGSQDLRNAPCIVAIRLVAHRGECRADLACLKADHLKACSAGRRQLSRATREDRVSPDRVSGKLPCVELRTATRGNLTR